MAAVPDTPLFQPLYRQIAGLITRGLDAGEWKPGEAIPSELELAARFKVSQGTVRKAIDELAGANLLVRRQGKGTFVATHSEERTQFRFLRLAPDDGSAERLSRKFLDCKRMRPSAEVAQALDIPTSQAVLQVRRLLFFRSAPVVLDDLWLPLALFKGLTEQRLSEYEGPLYGLFEAEFGVHMVRAEEQIRAVAAEPDAAMLLQVTPGAPLLSVSRVAFTYGDRPVELRRGLYDTRSHHYRNRLS
ncbi:MAG TPA: GntR family transcriptional regulator [Burkholderiaceae bacterium]|jgi:GntR family transcriptional regulator|nr:GntR family transcriptional regulator [Burkholderiaceae bacterium]